MANRVIYISFSRLTEKIALDWNLEYLIERGITVEYWDIADILRNKLHESHSLMTYYLRRFASYAELERRLTLPENIGAVYVIMIGLEPRFLPLFKLLRRHECKTVLFAWGAMPGMQLSRLRKLQFLFLNPFKLIFKIVSGLQLRVAQATGLIAPFDVVFSAGRVMAERFSKAKRIVPINLVDYDHFTRSTIETNFIEQKKYAVFLDTNLPYHTDLSLVGLQSLEPQRYFDSLNRFFSFVEDRFGVNVVIAAHPKSNYPPGAFNFRSVWRQATPQLVRHANFVITQTSTAISYAVLNFKPVVFVYTDDMLKLYSGSLMRELDALSEYLGGTLVNIDDSKSVAAFEIPMVAQEHYDRYRYDFLVSQESQYRTTSEIFFETIKAL